VVGWGQTRRPQKKAEQAELKTRSDLSMSKAVRVVFFCREQGRERKSQAQARPLKIRKAVFNGEGKTQFSFKSEPY